MLSIWIYDTQDRPEFPILKFSALSKPPVNTLSNLKMILQAMKEKPYRYKAVLKAQCDVTTRMISSMSVMHNFAKAVLFFHEESTDTNEYLKLFGSFVAMVASEGATVND